jgi:hypothetical protein
VAVAVVGLLLPLDPKPEEPVRLASGEAANIPIWTVDGSPARCTVPIRVQLLPSVES